MVVRCEIIFTSLSEDYHDTLLGEEKPNKVFWSLRVEKGIMGPKAKSLEAAKGHLS